MDFDSRVGYDSWPKGEPIWEISVQIVARTLEQRRPRMDARERRLAL